MQYALEAVTFVHDKDMGKAWCSLMWSMGQSGTLVTLAVSSLLGGVKLGPSKPSKKKKPENEIAL